MFRLFVVLARKGPGNYIFLGLIWLLYSRYWYFLFARNWIELKPNLLRIRLVLLRLSTLKCAIVIFIMISVTYPVIRKFYFLVLDLCWTLSRKVRGVGLPAVNLICGDLALDTWQSQWELENNG